MLTKQGHYGLARRVALLKLYVKNLHKIGPRTH